jgi:hypothetical protein
MDPAQRSDCQSSKESGGKPFSRDIAQIQPDGAVGDFEVVQKIAADRRNRLSWWDIVTPRERSDSEGSITLWSARASSNSSSRNFSSACSSAAGANVFIHQSKGGVLHREEGSAMRGV